MIHNAKTSHQLPHHGGASAFAEPYSNACCNTQVRATTLVREHPRYGLLLRMHVALLSTRSPTV
jgi:hypothetical protein